MKTDQTTPNLKNVEKTRNEGRAPATTSSTNMDQVEVAWRQLSYLREEILNSQRIRAQILGFKITAVTLGIGYILDNADKVHPIALIVVAYASVLFDFLIISKSIAIKRAGRYIREHLEKIIRKNSGWPEETPLWEEFMKDKKSRQVFSMISDFGLTVLASILAFSSPFMQTQQSSPLNPQITYGLMAGLAIILIIDLVAFFEPFKFYGK